mmetsp:Transcript_31841/g.93108  ORF Transcript_31841/g.93108 Transcript_31841/m.93108 type:complete len:326 (+) Transcript_31841:65-1042(+)
MPRPPASHLSDDEEESTRATPRSYTDDEVDPDFEVAKREARGKPAFRAQRALAAGPLGRRQRHSRWTDDDEDGADGVGQGSAAERDPKESPEKTRIRELTRQTRTLTDDCKKLRNERDRLLQDNADLEAENDRLKEALMARPSDACSAASHSRMTTPREPVQQDHSAAAAQLARELSREYLTGLFPYAAISGENLRLREAIRAAELEIAAVVSQVREAWHMREEVMSEMQHSCQEVDSLRLELAMRDRRIEGLEREVFDSRSRSEAVAAEAAMGRRLWRREDDAWALGRLDGSRGGRQPWGGFELPLLESLETAEAGWQRLKRLL